MNTPSKLKYMDFLPKIKPQRAIRVRAVAHSYTDYIRCLEFIEKCVSDIMLKLPKNSDITISKELLSSEMIEKTLHYGKKETETEYRFSQKEIKQKLIVEINKDPSLTPELIRRTASTYLSKCMEYGLDPDLTIVAHLFGS